MKYATKERVAEGTVVGVLASGASVAILAGFDRLTLEIGVLAIAFVSLFVSVAEVHDHYRKRPLTRKKVR